MRRKTRTEKRTSGMRGAVVALCAIGLFTFAGCLSISTHPRGAEPSARPMEDRPYEIVGQSEGESSSFRLFWIFPVTPSLDLNRAVEEAIIAKGGDNLIGVTWSVERQVWIVGTLIGVHVKGQVIRYKD